MGSLKENKAVTKERKEGASWEVTFGTSRSHARGVLDAGGGSVPSSSSRSTQRRV